MRDIEPTFAGYQLRGIIARDAVSSTYRAATQTHGGGRSVALQVSEPIAELDRNRIELARRKADMVRDIDDPGLARVLDVGSVDGRLYVATTWWESVTLDQLLDQRWHLSPADAVELLHPLAAGLDKVHAAGIVHGALSPHTIRVTSTTTTHGQHAYLTGFGIGDLVGLRVASRNRRDQEPALDDLLYVAPEQLRDDQRSSATDQYALACALYHCVSGRPPFVRETASALFGAHLFAQPPIAQLPADDASRALRERLIVGLAKRPAERHASCADLIGAGPVGPASAPARPHSDDRDRPRVPVTSASARRLIDLRPPAAIIPVLALVVAAMLAALMIISLRATPDTTTAALTDVSQAASAGQSAAESGQEPATAGEWDAAVAASPIMSVTRTDDHLIVVAADQIAALDPLTGEPRWQRSVAGGDATDAIVIDDAVVYRSSGLRALEVEDGRPRWARTDQLAPTRSLSADANGVLYGAGPGAGMAEVEAINPASGDELWHFHGENGRHINDDAQVAADDGLVVIGERDSLLALDPSGERVTTRLGRLEPTGSVWRADGAVAWLRTLTLTDDAVVLATRDGRICGYARDDGARRWCRRVRGVADRAPTLLAADGQLTVVTRSTVVALDTATGAPVWDAPADATVTAADATPDVVVVADAAGTVRGLDASSGAQQWVREDQGRITSLTLADGAVYAGLRDGTVLRLGPPSTD